MKRRMKRSLLFLTVTCAVARRVFDKIFNQGRFQVADQIYARDFVNRRLHRNFTLVEDQAAVHAEKQAFPDLRITVDRMVAEIVRPKPVPPYLRRRARIRLRESIENQPLFLGRNADSGIAYEGPMRIRIVVLCGASIIPPTIQRLLPNVRGRRGVPDSISLFMLGRSAAIETTVVGRSLDRRPPRD